MEKLTLYLPWDIVDKCNGFSIDCGSSVCKIIYLHKEDWKEPDQRKEDSAPMRCVNFCQTNLDAAICYLKERAFIKRTSPADKPLIYTTGVGGSRFATKIREGLQIQTRNITERECFVAGFIYLLKNMTIGELAHGLNQEVVQKVVANNEKMKELVKSMMKDAGNFETDESADKHGRHPQELPLEGEMKFTDYENIFPCFLVVLGSGSAVFAIEADGSYKVANIFGFSGRMFVGLGSLLLNAKSYEELMTKAENGNMRSIHEYASDLVTGIDQGENNFYSHLNEAKDTYEEPGFIFGKGVSKDADSFKSEDLARGLLWTTIYSMVQNVHVPLKYFTKVHHVFFSGSFPERPINRDFVLERWLHREAEATQFFHLEHYSHTHFLKHGQYLGALGAYLNKELQFIKEEKTSSEK